MASIRQLDENIKWCHKEDLPANLVGAAVLVYQDRVTHAGIFIRYNGTNKIFHFNGQDIELEDVYEGELYFYKQLAFINPALAPSFLSHCEIVKENANPRYGYFYTGSMYDGAGKFLSPGEMPEYMTCVGFCLNFLKFFMGGAEFFYFRDWTSKDLGKDEKFVEWFIDKHVKPFYPDIDIRLFNEGIRRIYPIEYITGAFSDALPVLKSFTDQYMGRIQAAILKKTSEARA